MSTSQKHDNFVGKPMGNKDVTELAGIGPVLRANLSNKGYDKAYLVLGQFLVFYKNKELLKVWLHVTCGANAEQQQDCFECINQWCTQHL